MSNYKRYLELKNDFEESERLKEFFRQSHIEFTLEIGRFLYVNNSRNCGVNASLITALNVVLENNKDKLLEMAIEELRKELTLKGSSIKEELKQTILEINERESKL